MNIFDRSHAHTRSKHNLVECDCRTYYSSHFFNLDLVVLKGRTDKKIILVKFRLAHLMLTLGIISKNIKWWKFKSLKFLTVVDSRQVFKNRNHDVTPDYLDL